MTTDMIRDWCDKMDAKHGKGVYHFSLLYSFETMKEELENTVGKYLDDPTAEQLTSDLEMAIMPVYDYKDGIIDNYYTQIKNGEVE